MIKGKHRSYVLGLDAGVRTARRLSFLTLFLLGTQDSALPSQHSALLPLFLLFTLLGVTAPAQTQDGAPTLKWVEAARDVTINGDLDRNAQILLSDFTQRMVLLSSRINKAVVFDLTDKTVSTAAKDEFHFAPDRTTAESDSLVTSEALGEFTLTDEINYSFTLEDKKIAITRHLGLAGDLVEKKLWEALPVWRAVMDSYKPDPDAVAALKACAVDTSITVVLGTWCPDSKNHVPRLLRAIKEAKNPRLRVRLIGVTYKIKEPPAVIKQFQIVHVPTVIVERGGVEIGRVTENPIAATIEQDLAAILAGKSSAAKAP